MAKKKKKKDNIIVRALKQINEGSKQAHKRMMQPVAQPKRGNGSRTQPKAPVRQGGGGVGKALSGLNQQSQAAHRRVMQPAANPYQKSSEVRRRLAQAPKSRAERLGRTFELNLTNRFGGEALTFLGKHGGDRLATLRSEARFYMGRNKVPRMTKDFKRRMPGMKSDANEHERYIEDVFRKGSGGIQGYIWDMLHSGKDPKRIYKELDRIGRPEFKKDIAGWYPSKAGQQILADYNKAMATNMAGTGKAEKYLNMGVGELAHMLPSMALGGAAGGAAKAASMAQKAASAAKATKAANTAARLAGTGLGVGGTAYGAAYDRAFNEGATEKGAKRYAQLSGASEAGLGMALGKIPGLGKPLVPLEKALGKKLPQAGAGAYMARKAINAAGEGVEEGLQEVVDPYMQRASYNPKAANASLGDVAESALMGAAIGGVLGSGRQIGHEGGETYGLKDLREGLKGLKRNKKKAGPLVDPTVNPLLDTGRVGRGNPLVAKVQNNPNIAQVADQPIGPVRPTGSGQVAGSAGLDIGFMPKVSSHVPTSIANDQPATSPMSSLPPIGPAPAAVPPVDKRVIDQPTAPAMNMPFTGAPGHPVMNTGLPEPVTERPFNLTSEGPSLPHLETPRPNMAGGQASLAVDDGQLLNPPIRPDFGQEKAAPEAVTEDLSFVSPGMRQFLDDVSKRSGLDIRISNEMGQAKGLLQGQTVYLNEALFDGNPEYAVTSILTHELTHAMEGTSEYTRLADLAVEAMSADYGGMDFAGLVERKRQEYAAGGVNLDTDGAKKEIVAEFMEQAMSDPVTAQRLLTQEPGAFKRMLQWIKDALETIINKASLRKDKVAQAQYKCYRKAQKVFVEALNNNLAGKGEGQFAIDYVPVKTEDGHKVVPIVISEADLYEFGFDENLSQEDNFYRMRKEVEKAARSQLQGKILIGADDREMTTKYPTERYDLAGELTYGRQLREDKTVRNRGLSYLDMALNVEEIAMTLKTLPKVNSPHKHTDMAAKGFDAPMFLFMDGNGETFICKAKVATNEDGVNTLYAIPSMKRFNIEEDTLTKEREAALNVVGNYVEAEKKEPPFSGEMGLKNTFNPAGPGASTSPNPRKENSFIDPTIPPDNLVVNEKNNENGQYAISPHLETPIERGNRLAREMGLKEKGLKALKLDPLGRERVGSYKKYGPEMKGFADNDHLLGRLGNARSALYARLVDDASPLVHLSKALPEEYKNGEVDRVMIEDRLQQVRQAGGTVDYIAEKALLDADGQVIGASWADMDALVPKKLRGEFNAYRQALHQLDRLQEGKDVTSDTLERATWKVANIEKVHPEFVDIVDRQNAWWRAFMQAWAVDTGLISQDTFNQWQEKYPNYFPTYRTKKKTGNNGIQLMDSGAFKEAKGSHEEVADYSDNMMRKVAEIVVAERKNELHGDIVKALSLGDYDMRGWGRVLGKGDLEEAHVEDGFELFPESTEAGKEQTEKGRNAFIYRKDGEAIPFSVNNDLAYGLNALQGKDFGQLAYPLKLMRTGVGGMKMVTTGINPYFAINNGVRDIQAGFVHSSANAKYPKEYAEAMTSILSNGDMWNEYRQMGGAASGFYSDTRDMVRAYSKRKGKGAKVLTALGAFNEVIEQTPRLLEYSRVRKEALDEGFSLKEARIKAANAAANATVNFSRSGTFTKALDSYVPYLNAAVQGIDWTIREMKNNPVGVVAKGKKTEQRTWMPLVATLKL